MLREPFNSSALMDTPTQSTTILENVETNNGTNNGANIEMNVEANVETNNGAKLLPVQPYQVKICFDSTNDSIL